MKNPVVHFEVVAKDGEAAQEFYSKLFDWKLDTDNPEKYGSLEAPESGGIGGGIGTAPEGSPGHVTFYVSVDDLQSYLDKAESLGGKTIMPPTEIPDQVTFALFADPQGNVVGMVKGEMESQ
ncbi:MAG: VOC family protein [Chloroflexi bacterium]|nr:VOC family protein [Chloroflexota bacterium]